MKFKTNMPVKQATLSAKVVRKNGKIEDLGVIAKHRRGFFAGVKAWLRKRKIWG